MAQFDDGKELGALRTIGEVADALGIKQHVLRYWEQQFPMLQPLKRSGGRRYYRPEDVALVEAIDRLVNREGYTLKGAKKALAHKDMASDIEQAPAPSAQPVEADTSAGEASPSPLPLVDELPDDGGLDAFFGRPQIEPEDGVDEMPELAPEPQAAALASDELLIQLKSIRDRLARALAA